MMPTRLRLYEQRQRLLGTHARFDDDCMIDSRKVDSHFAIGVEIGNRCQLHIDFLVVFLVFQ